MKICNVCQGQFGAGVMSFSSRGEVCPPCAQGIDGPAPAERSAGRVPGIIASLAAAAPFFAHVRVVTNGSFRDYVAIGAGGVALLLGAASLLLSLMARSRRLIDYGPAALSCALGFFHLLRGFGLIFPS